MHNVLHFCCRGALNTAVSTLPRLRLYQFKTGASFPQTHTKSYSPEEPSSQQKSFSDFSNVCSSDTVKMCAFTNTVCHGFCLSPEPALHHCRKSTENDVIMILLLIPHISYWFYNIEEVQPPWSRKWLYVELLFRDFWELPHFLMEQASQNIGQEGR